MLHSDPSRARKFKASRPGPTRNHSAASQGIRRHLRFELLEDRLYLTTVVGTASDDTLVVSATGPDSGTYSLNGAPAVAFVGTTTFQFDGLDGNDLLRINNPAGALFAPSSGISYNGGGQAGDSLENLGGAATSGSYSVGPASGDGVLLHTGGALTQTISFTGLAPALDTVAEPAFTITANDAANTITLDDGAALGDGLLRLSIDAFEPIQFAGKTHVVVNAGGSGADLNDTINVNYTEVSTGLSTVTFNADDGGDFILVQATPAGVTTNANGDSGDDVFLFDSNAFAAGGTFNGILGPVTVGGGDNSTLSTVSITTGCGVTTTLVAGDRVIFTDAGNTVGQNSVYSLSDTRFQRISNSPGGTATGQVTFATLERADLLTGAGNDDILVSTTHDQSTLIVSPGGGNDTVTVQNTGAGSIVFVDGGSGADAIDVQTTGANSAVLAAGGSEDDAITLENTGDTSRVTLNGGAGADTLNVHATGINSRTEVNGEGGNDTINLGSVAGSLDTIQGHLCIAGNANDATPTVTRTVTCDGVTVSTTLPVGDTLNLNDHGDGDGNTYRLNGGQLERNGVTNIFFGPPDVSTAPETINLNAGAGTDNIIIETTPDAATLAVNAGPGVDFFTVQNTGSGSVGAASLTVLGGQGDSDVIDVTTTGTGSVTIINGGGEPGAGDTIRLAGNGAASGVQLNGQGGADQINVFATSAGSATIVNGGTENDHVFLGNSGNTLDTIQGVVCVDGQGNAGGAGDALTFSDQASPAGVGGVGNTYAIAASTVTRNGVAPVTFANIEQLALNAGLGSDTIDVTPGVGTTINVDGNLPTPPTNPGDTLDVDTSGTAGPLLTSSSSPVGFQGAYTFGNRRPVNFQEIETLANDIVDLTITKTDGKPTETAGTPVTYTIVVSNNGPLGVTGATVIDVFPAIISGVTFTSVASGGATGNTPAGTGDIDDTVSLPIGTSITYTANGTIDSTAIGTLFNTATVNPPAGFTEFNPADNSATDTDMLAVITAGVDAGGTLTIEGTETDDIVTITGVGVGTGVYSVTTQQGLQPAQTQTVTGVTNISVNLRAGNDRLTMNNVYLIGSIIVDMESGNDTVTLGNADVVSTQQDLDVDLGTGNDLLDGKRIFIAGDQILGGGDGDDDMIFDGFASPFTLGTSAAGSANWTGGNGDDTVHVVYAFIVGAWTIDLGAGNDSLNVFGSAASGDVTYFGGAGIDGLTVDTNFFDANQLLDGGGDGDTIFLANGLGTELATINGAAGADTITVTNHTAAQLTIDSGADNDTVEVRSSAFDRFFARLGDGDDQLTLFGNLFRIEADLDGGAGADRLIDQGNDVRGVLRTRFFATFG
jgi:hypothetical protein